MAPPPLKQVDIDAMRRADHGETLDATAQHGPQQGHGLARGQAAADRDDGAVRDPRSEIFKRRPLVGIGVDGPWPRLGHLPAHGSAHLSRTSYAVPRRLRIRSAAFSAIMIVGAFVLPLTIVGMIDASTTRNPSIPCTLRWESTTAISSLPILHVPAGCQVVEAVRLHKGLDIRVAPRIRARRYLLATDIVEWLGVENAEVPAHAGNGASHVVGYAQVVEIDDRPIERIGRSERDLAAAQRPVDIGR